MLSGDHSGEVIDRTGRLWETLGSSRRENSEEKQRRYEP
jgi:hypothetical protein